MGSAIGQKLRTSLARQQHLMTRSVQQAGARFPNPLNYLAG